jgi:sugar lactone lactonase YvrE
MTRTLAADLVLDAHAEVGEGPAWDAERACLIWIDITGGTVHTYDPATGDARAYDVGQHVGAAVPSGDNGLLLAVRDGIALLTTDSEVRMLARIEADRPGNRMNDAKCDPQGRLWAGTMAYDVTPGAGTLYRYTSAGVSAVLPGVTLSNGLGWSPDGWLMYYIDSDTQRVDGFDFDGATGTVSRRRVIVTIDPADGMPDGMTTDDDGCLWVALWGAGIVRRYTPDGRLDAEVRLPATQITSCAFGGPDRDTLFITSAAYRLSPDALLSQPHAGALFAAEPGVTGPTANPFAG